MIPLEAGLNPEQRGDPWVLCQKVEGGGQRSWVCLSQEGGVRRGMGEGERKSDSHYTTNSFIFND